FSDSFLGSSGSHDLVIIVGDGTYYEFRNIRIMYRTLAAGIRRTHLRKERLSDGPGCRHWRR
ncbi:MAG: hypothetical protein KDE50_12215, partial [Caldilineaceae bacterium]|nr:hypothetical protein [Caldilineaceae bacterium]